jgi:integrase/recombinase XerD
MNLGEQVLSDLVVALKDLYPYIEVENTKNKLSSVLSEYYIQRAELSLGTSRS